MTQHKKLETPEIISLLHEIGQRVKLQDGNRFRAQAYITAADSLRAITRPLSEIITAGELTSIPGVGRAIASLIERLYHTGSAPTLDMLRKEIPDGVIQMLSIPGIRTDQIRKLYETTGISNVAALQKAIENKELEGKRGFSPVFQQKVLQGLKLQREVGHKQHIHRATALLEAAKHNLGTTHPELRDITIAGDLRRQCELIEDLCLVAIGDKRRAVKPILGDIKLHLCPEEHFGSTLLLATGSTAHIQLLAALASKKHL